MSIDPGEGAPAGGGETPGASEVRTSDRLQSMLAQAVEGQQSEQRELVGALTDMRNQVLRLGQEIAAIRTGGPGGSGADPAALNAVTVELREAVRFLSERLDGVTRMVAQRGEELADVRAALSAVDAHVRSQTETIGVLSQGLQALPSYGERVSALHDAIGAVHNRLAALETTVAQSADPAGIDRRLAGIEAAIRPLGEQVAESRQAAGNHAASLAEASARIAEQAQALQAHSSSLDALHERVRAIAEGTQAALAVPPVFDESTIAGLEAKLSAISAEVANLARRDSAPAPDPEAFAAAVREVEQRLRAHVDDAVIALAEILVRRRPAATADQITGTPLTGRESSSYQPAEGYAAPLRSDDEPPAPAAPVAVLPGEEEGDSSTPVVDFSVAEFADEDASDAPAADALVDVEPEDDELADQGEPAGYDEPPVEAGRDDAAEDEAEQYDDGDYFAATPDDGGPGDETEASDDRDELDDTSEIKFPPPVVMPPAPMPPSPPAAWSPEVPPERPEADPSTPNVVPDERKRRWFSR